MRLPPFLRENITLPRSSLYKMNPASIKAILLCLANELDALNQTRKEIEQGMQIEALTLCEKLERSRDTLPGAF